MNTHPQMTLTLAAIALLVGCQEIGGPAAPSLPSDPSAARASGRLPAAPSNTSAVAVSESQIDLTWRDNSSNETRFEVHRSAGGAFSLLTTTAANVAAHRDQGLEPGTQYCYQVRAVRVAGSKTTYSPFSNMACTMTLPPPASEANAKPLNSSSVVVAWTGNSTSATSFRIYRSTNDGSSWELAGLAQDPYRNVFVDSPVPSELSICYQVVASNPSGDAEPSNTVCTTPPAGPTNLTVTPLNSETVLLTWEDNSVVEDGYQVRVFFCYGDEVVAELPPNSTSYEYRLLFSQGCVEEEPDWSGVGIAATKDGGTSDFATYYYLE